VLREFTSKRHVKLSRVTIKAKDEGGEEEAKKNPRRRRASSSGERKESDRSLAKVLLLGLLQHVNRRISSVLLNQNEPFPMSHLLGRLRRARSYVAHSRTYPSLQVMRQADEEAVPEPHEPGHHASSPDGHADTPTDVDLEALVPPHGVVIGRRFARQWKPALQSIAEG
jgi:hypothetical protein